MTRQNLFGHPGKGWLAFNRIAVVFAMASVMLTGLRAGAQVLYGSLSGTVTDPSGAAIANAKVDAVEMHKGIRMEAVTDSTGLYRISDMLPGLWKITVTAPGFNTAETDNIVLDANTVVREDEKLSVAKANVTVTVTTAPPELQTDRADVHTDLSTVELQEMPAVSSEGKNFQDLLRIVPGSTLPAENNSAGGNPERAMTSNVNGQSSQGNDTRIDGILDAYPWLPNNVAYVPPEDSIETVNIVTNSFDAEQGMANGAEVNVTTKSGTNQFHGDAHEFHTDDRLTALDYFDNPATYHRPLMVFNQYGGAIGGPIKRDKLFFFGDWQGTHQPLAPANGNPQTVPFGSLVESTAKSAGCFDFSEFQTAAYGLVDSSGNPVQIYDPNSGNANGTGRTPLTCANGDAGIPLSRVDPAALAMAALIPAPTYNTLDSDNYLDSQVGYYHTNNYDAKINWVPTQKTTAFGHFSTSQGDIFDPPSLGPLAQGNATNGGQLGNTYIHIYEFGAGATHTFTPNLLLDGVIGYTRQHLEAAGPGPDSPYGLDTLKIPGTNNSQDPSDPLYYGVPAFQFSTNGFTNLGNPNTGNPFEFRDNQYVAAGNVTWIKKRHQIRVGAEWNHTGLNHFQPQGGTFQTARGSFESTGVVTEQVTCPSSSAITGCSATDPPNNIEYNSYADFLLGLPYETGKAVQDTDPIALRWSEWAIYARDMWQVNPKLSLNYGLRWEFYPMAYSDHGKGARVLDPTTMQVLIGGYGSVPENDGVQVGHGIFGPRIGIDYRLTDKTVVRAGFGISSDDNNWRYLRNDYPADTISTFTGEATGGTTGATDNGPFSPGSSLTGTNATGPYTNLPTGIVLIPVPNISSGSIPLPSGVTTNTIGTYPTFRRGYIYSYNLTLEQQFAGFVADAAFVGDNEIRPIINEDINAAPAGGGTAGQVLNAEFGQTWGAIQSLEPLGNDYYDSLQTKLTRHIGQSSQIGILYTWSKAEDLEDNEELNSPLWQYPAYFSLNKALAGYDRKYNYETYWVYALPFGKGQSMANHGMASAFAGGWSIAGVLSRLSGTPFTVTYNSGALDSPGNTETANIVAPIHLTGGKPFAVAADCAQAPSCSYFSQSSFGPVTTAGTLGNSGRNIIRGPGYFNLDANLFRNFKITEFLTFQFEADAFSLTNTPHFANPDSNLGDADFGQVTGGLQQAYASLGGSEGQRLWYFGGKLIF